MRFGIHLKNAALLSALFGAAFVFGAAHQVLTKLGLVQRRKRC